VNKICTFLDKVKGNWVKLYFAVSLLLIVFIFGIVTGNKRLFPHDPLLQGWVAAKDWIKDNNFNHYFGIRPEKFIYPEPSPNKLFSLKIIYLIKVNFQE